MLDADTIDIDDLPATLREMAALIGLVATLTLVRHFGGTRLYVPKAAAPEHIIARLIGFEAMVRLCTHYGAQFQGLDIPRALDATIAVRNREIRRQAALGKSHRELAREFHLTERWVREILGEAPLPSGQADLFGGR